VVSVVRIVDMNTTKRPMTIALASLTAAGLAALLLTAGASPSAAATRSAVAHGGPTLTGATLTLNHPTVYPHVDGYRDSLGIAVTKRIVGASGTIPLTGKVTITRAGKTVARFPISTSAAETYDWSGRVAGKIVAGTYAVTATVTAPSGTITKRATVSVSHKKLVTHTSTVTVSAQDYFQRSYSALSGKSGCVPVDAGAISCVSAKGAPATGSNYVAVPARVLQFAGYRQYSASASVKISQASVVAGTDTYWEWDGTHHFAFTSAGTHTTSSSSFGAGQDAQLLTFRVGGGSRARFDVVSIRYVYAVLA
jgi:hypothetical protein